MVVHFSPSISHWLQLKALVRKQTKIWCRQVIEGNQILESYTMSLTFFFSSAFDFAWGRPWSFCSTVLVILAAKLQGIPFFSGCRNQHKMCLWAVQYGSKSWREKIRKKKTIIAVSKSIKFFSYSLLNIFMWQIGTIAEILKTVQKSEHTP